MRSIKSILNKLTVEKFDELFKKLIACGLEKKEYVEFLMAEVFEKATTQHHFIPMYAELCVNLNDWLEQTQEEGGAEVKFKRILLNECQNFFEKCLKPPE